MKLVSTTPSDVDIKPFIELPKINPDGCVGSDACGQCDSCQVRARETCVVLAERSQRASKKSFRHGGGRRQFEGRLLTVLTALDILPEMEPEQAERVQGIVKESQHMHEIGRKGNMR